MKSALPPDELISQVLTLMNRRQNDTDLPLYGIEDVHPGLARLAARASVHSSRTIDKALAADVFGKVGRQSDLPYVAVLLDDRHWGIRTYALEAIGRIGGKAALPLIYRGLKDKAPIVRQYAAEELWRSGVDAREFLHDLIRRDRAARARLGYYEALFRMGEPEWLERIARMLDAPSPLCAVSINMLAAIAEEMLLTSEQIAMVRRYLDAPSVDHEYAKHLYEALDAASARLAGETEPAEPALNEL